ncbi:MAG: class III extradiol dioxygenase subunit B-like domain-containing protein [Aeromicrobium sp.]
MIVAVAVCPQPPALVPEVASGAAGELDDVREAALASVSALVGVRPNRVVVVGTGSLSGQVDESAGGTMAGHGVGVVAGGDDEVLPLSLTVGAWLLDRAGWRGPRTYTTSAVPADDRVALLVMADGSARRSLTAPGYLDDRAAAYDDTIAAALAAGDADVLASLDVDLGDDLLAAGPRALVVLGEMTKGAAVTARLRWDGAPFGVGYWVADWSIT